MNKGKGRNIAALEIKNYMICNTDNVGQMSGCNICVATEGLSLRPGVTPSITYAWQPYERQYPCGECRLGFFGPRITENKYEKTCTKCVNDPTLGAVFTPRTAKEELGLSDNCYKCKESGPLGTYIFEPVCPAGTECNSDTGACVDTEGGGFCYDPCTGRNLDIPPCHVCISPPKSILGGNDCKAVRDNCSAEWRDARDWWYKSNMRCNEETNSCECTISECPSNKPELMSGPQWNIYINKSGKTYDDYGCWCECTYDYSILIEGKEDPCDFLQHIRPFKYDADNCDCVYDTSAQSLLVQNILP